MAGRDERRTDYGVVKIHRDVIAQVASMAAVEVSGVTRISTSIFTEALRILSWGHTLKHPIKIEFRENNEVVIVIPIIVNYGVNIPMVAANVQENVKRAVEKMAGLYPIEIDIKVKGVGVK